MSKQLHFGFSTLHSRRNRYNLCKVVDLQVNKHLIICQLNLHAFFESCSTCAMNTFYPGSGSTCTACPGTTTLAGAAFVIGGTATSCTAGTCAANSYYPGGNATACTSCPGSSTLAAAPFTVGSAATMCSGSCANDTYYPGIGGTCTVCPNNSTLASALFTVGATATTCAR